jgi:hypothetical protein
LRHYIQRRSLQLEGDPERPERALFLDPRTKAEVAASAAGSVVFLPRWGC